MAKKMLIDATHPEETRVVVVDGTKVEEFDFESLSKRQLAGNIYLAKVTRVEPSLQAAFVDYGGNRHGFLAFSEIHPDYYQIPVADREALLAEEREYAEAMAAEADEDAKPKRRRARRRKPDTRAEAVKGDPVARGTPSGMDIVDLDNEDGEDGPGGAEAAEAASWDDDGPADATYAEPTGDTAHVAEEAASGSLDPRTEPEDDTDEGEQDDDSGEDGDDAASGAETVADDDTEEDIRPARKARPRKYKIQEVVKVRQIMLVQVVKEERGNKGAALTTYLSIAGRYCVLMPNTARGGGISRKITNAADRKKLKEIATALDVPQGAGLIVRTAGAKRTKAEIKRDYEYLQRQWEQVRSLTLQSIAPALIYQEGDLIHRTIRDLYNRDIDEVLVEGDEGYRRAKDFMKMIMPSHAKNVKHYTEAMPLFARFQVESYLSSMFNPTVQLKSGGYIVIGVTEALVAIDVNSGKATKEGS
ncbi:MAG: Rne/Rng family ribonuclease, partial [Roseicyclus sp.]